MTHYFEQMTRTYTLTVSVKVAKVNDPKNEEDMNQLCDWIIKAVRKATDGIDGGTNRLSVDVQRNV